MSDVIKIRMYNVGFGDCFLLTLPGNYTILVDAGFHSQGKGMFGGNELVTQIRDDLIAIKNQPRIDVVIATHRHQDHVYAFNSDVWSEVEVGEVWLPWVEDRSNSEATKLWKKQNHFAMQLAAAVPQFRLRGNSKKNVEFMLWNAGVLDLPEFDAGGWSNKNALDCLHEGFKRRDKIRPRFLPEKEAFPETFETSVLPGVKVHVLGPARNADLIVDLDPEADGETYRALALMAAGAGNTSQMIDLVPFGKDWQVGNDGEIPPLDDSERERIDALARNADAEFAAEMVDNMINSTSLVLILEIGKARLLLPGDAEWGTWKRILAQEDACDLLRGSTFFKVGHHGSHNATSKTLVEKILPQGIPAMISTQEGAGRYRNGIPLKDLLTALGKSEIKFVRSDRADGALPTGFTSEASQKWVDLELPC